MDVAEFIAVCIDNSSEAHSRHTFRPQRDAIEYYCKAKFKANPETKVVLLSVAKGGYAFVLPPTSDSGKIRDNLKRIFDHPARTLSFTMAVDRSWVLFAGCPQNMQKRMLFLAGSPVNLFGTEVDYGSILKGLGVAVDVVNFYLEDEFKNTGLGNLLDVCIKGGLKSTRMELDAFVEAAMSNGNSHIEHVKPRDSIREVLRNSILRDNLGLSTKTDRHKRAKRQDHDVGHYKHVRSEAFSLKNEGAKLGKRKAIYAAGDYKHVRSEAFSLGNDGSQLGKRKAIYAAGDYKHVRSEAFSLENEGAKLGKRKAIYAAGDYKHVRSEAFSLGSDGSQLGKRKAIYAVGDYKHVRSEAFSLGNEGAQLGKRKAIYAAEDYKVIRYEAFSLGNEWAKLGKRKAMYA